MAARAPPKGASGAWHTGGVFMASGLELGLRYVLSDGLSALQLTAAGISYRITWHLCRGAAATDTMHYALIAS
jgi:hypothetical protein